jgi:hypothetical protein
LGEVAEDGDRAFAGAAGDDPALHRGEVLGLVDDDVAVRGRGFAEFQVGLDLVEDEEVGRGRLRGLAGHERGLVLGEDAAGGVGAEGRVAVELLHDGLGVELGPHRVEEALDRRGPLELGGPLAVRGVAGADLGLAARALHDRVLDRFATGGVGAGVLAGVRDSRLEVVEAEPPAPAAVGDQQAVVGGDAAGGGGADVAPDGAFADEGHAGVVLDDGGVVGVGGGGGVGAGELLDGDLPDGGLAEGGQDARDVGEEALVSV